MRREASGSAWDVGCWTRTMRQGSNTTRSRREFSCENIAPVASRSDAQGGAERGQEEGAKQKTRGYCLGFVWLPLLDSNHATRFAHYVRCTERIAKQFSPLMLLAERNV